MSTYRRVAFPVLLILGLARAEVAAAQELDTLDKKDLRSALSASDLLDPSTTSSVTGIGKPPRVGPNFQANAPQQAFPNGLLGRSETSIAGTDDGNFLVAGFNDAQGFCGPPFEVVATCTPQSPSGLSGYAFSSDGGRTWTDGAAPPLFSDVFTRGDPWLDMGGFDNATFFYANLAINAVTGADLGVSVHRGHFRGTSFAWSDVHTFNAPGAAFTTQVGTVAVPNDFYDKEAIAVAKDGSGRAYVSVTNFIKTCGFPQNGFGQIEVWRTSDGGNTWQGPTIVSPDRTFITTPGQTGCGQTGISQQSSVPAIGPKGEVYVTWQFGPTFNPGVSTNADIFVARSLDGGVTFALPVSVASINSLRGAVPVAYTRDRINDHPRIAVATTGPNKGRVYVTYASAVAPAAAGALTLCVIPSVNSATRGCRAQVLTSTQVFVAFSDDKGQTWTSVPAAPTPPATGLKRWWPVVSVQPGGNVDVVYYESAEAPVSGGAQCPISVGVNDVIDGVARARFRQGPAHSSVDVFWARSIDGGNSYKAPIKVTTTTTDWCLVGSNIRPNMGDYIGSFSGGNRVLPLWADGRNGVPDAFFATGLGAGKSR